MKSSVIDTAPRTLAALPRRRFIAAVAALAVLGGCATLAPRDPLVVHVAGIEPAPAEGLEMRFVIRLRVQNPNDVALDFHGLAVTLELNDQPLATGVSDAAGSVPRYGEAIIAVPVTVSAVDVMRQVLGFVQAPDAGAVRYRVLGKIDGGMFGSRRFSEEGSLAPGQLLQPPR